MTTNLDESKSIKAAVEAAVGLFAGRTLTVLTGAGISTDSGIPDYRGNGSPRRSPMTFQQFLSDISFRRRYWAGSHLGWLRFSGAKPNAGHRALAQLEDKGIVNGILTQNVDGLHYRAGSERVIELHGNVAQVLCLDCGQYFSRESIARRLTDANPLASQAEFTRLASSAELRPDGDSEVGQFHEFLIPACTNCGGMLKPDVVFFGELIPSERFESARNTLNNGDALLVAGSSLVVNSGIRLLEQAKRLGHPIVIINRGSTRGDARATIKLDAGTSEALAEIALRLERRKY